MPKSHTIICHISGPQVPSNLAEPFTWNLQMPKWNHAAHAAHSHIGSQLIPTDSMHTLLSYIYVSISIYLSIEYLAYFFFSRVCNTKI